MNPFNIAAVSIGCIVVIGAVISVVLEGILSKHINESPIPDVTPTSTPVPKITESGTTRLKVMGTTISGTIEFSSRFTSNPKMVNATLDTTLLGTHATLDSFTITSPSTASTTISTQNFPLANPQNRAMASIPGASTAVNLGCMLDSTGQLWLAHTNDDDIFVVKRTTSGIINMEVDSVNHFVSETADQYIYFFEHKANMFMIFTGDTSGAIIKYGPVSGTSMPNTVTGLSGSLTGRPTVDPADDMHLLLQYKSGVNWGWHESYDGGLTYTKTTSLTTQPTFYGQELMFINDTTALFINKNSSTYIKPIRYKNNPPTFTNWSTIRTPVTPTHGAMLASAIFEKNIAYVFSNGASTKDVYISHHDNETGFEGWTYPVLVGDFVDTTESSLHLGSSNGIPWVLRRSGTNVYASYNDQADARGTWATPFLLMTCANVTGALRVDFHDDGLLITTYDGTNVMLNFIPTAVTISWTVEEA